MTLRALVEQVEWAQRIDDLERGDAVPLDWLPAQEDWLNQKLTHVVLTEPEAQWVPIFENGVCVRMVWRDPSHDAQTGASGSSSRVDQSAGFPRSAGGLSGASIQAGGSGSQLVPEPDANPSSKEEG